MHPPTRTGTVLGKRKASKLVLHLASSPEPSSDSPFEPIASTSKNAGPLILVNGSLVPSTKKRYKCTYDGCEKAYGKPTRLAEHERSHTDTRPFVCAECAKSFLRDTHLQAHMRSHLPESARPLVCTEPGCERRFWTNQQLRNHSNLHAGAKPFPCTQPSCEEAFVKHHQLREHLCSAHAPPGTKPFPCDHEGCDKSFDTKQHLRAHSKVHNEKRYTCANADCLTPGAEITYFPTWTALQHHIRTIHPPSCSHPSCNGRVFSSQHNLRAHQKLHEQRDLETRLEAPGSDGDDDINDRPRKKRRGGEVGRDWKCTWPGCTKDFKSEKTLTIHTDVTHLKRRDHVCPHEGCGHAFGYKHLLQRHFAKIHSQHSGSGSGEDEPEHMETTDSLEFNIDDLTGFSYATKAEARLNTGKAVRCPYPHINGLSYLTVDVEGEQNMQLAEDKMTTSCEFVFGRAYDLRRHLKAIHGIQAEKDSVDEWMKREGEKSKSKPRI